MDISNEAESFNCKCGRWGEVETEKGPVDLFPTEPTDDAALRRGWDLILAGIGMPARSALLLRRVVHWTTAPHTQAIACFACSHPSFLIKNKKSNLSVGLFIFMRKMGLEPTRKQYAQDP